MPKCDKCGAMYEETYKFCPACGASNTPNQKNEQNATPVEPQNFNNSDIDAEGNKIYALLSYIGILWIIPLIVAPNSKFARYHANQGLVLFIFEAVASVLITIITTIFSFIPFFGWFTWFLWPVYGIGIFAMTLIGILNAISKKMIPLPIIGKINILK